MTPHGTSGCHRPGLRKARVEKRKITYFFTLLQARVGAVDYALYYTCEIVRQATVGKKRNGEKRWKYSIVMAYLWFWISLSFCVLLISIIAFMQVLFLLPVFCIGCLQTISNLTKFILTFLLYFTKVDSHIQCITLVQNVYRNCIRILRVCN